LPARPPTCRQLDARRSGRARSRCAAGQHRPGVRQVRPDADLQEVASGVTSPKDLKGKTLGVWFGGNEYPFLNWMAKLGYKPDTDIKVLKQGFNVDPLLQNQAACISTMIYNEYWQVVDAGVKESDLVTFFYEDQGVASLEDGLYVLDSNLKDPAFVGAHGQVPQGQLQGLERRGEEPGRSCQDRGGRRHVGQRHLKVQKRQMENVAKLISNANTAEDRLPGAGRL
jgi:NitT/TauT family transport system substrate-binding protein